MSKAEQAERDRAKAAVMEEVDRLAERLVSTLSDAIKIPSVNPKYPGQNYQAVVGAEGDVAALMADLYREAGAEVEMVTVERGRDNACGRVRGTGGGRSLLLNGHVDVVPEGRLDRWKEAPYSGLVTDDRVIGRGATDMKGGLVSHAFAAIALRRSGVQLAGDLVLQSVVGEEVGDHEAGTTAVLDAGYVADAAIVCEPSSFSEAPSDVVPSTPGLLWFSISMEGKAAHSGLRGLTIHPTLDGEALGVNTIDKFWIVYNALRGLEDEWARTNRHPLWAPGYFNLLPGVLQANPHGIFVPFFLADTLTVEYCVYHHPDRDNGDVMQEIETVIARAAASDTWLREHPPVIEWKLLWEPYTTPAGHSLLSSVARGHERAEAHAGRPPVVAESGFLGVCDLTWMERKNIEGLVYGPGVGSTCHADNEYVMIDQLVTASKTYALTAIDHCGMAGVGDA